MKVKFSAFLTIPALAVILAGCSKGGGSSVSTTTGWDYNEAENGGFEVIGGSEQETGPGLVLIEGGTFSGSAGYLLTILLYIKKHYLIHWFGEGPWHITNLMYNIISDILRTTSIRLLV
jgi:hypothetical protein